MYYTQEQIDRANQADLVFFLQSQGEQLTRAGNEYRWKRHDSLTVRGNKWYRHSQSKGGGPVDFVMEFFSKSFTEAVELLTGEKGAALPPDRPSPAPISDFRLPPRSPDNRIARNYLTTARRIDEDVSGFFFSTGDIYEETAHHNAVFVGRNESGIVQSFFQPFGKHPAFTGYGFIKLFVLVGRQAVIPTGVKVIAVTPEVRKVRNPLPAHKSSLLVEKFAVKTFAAPRSRSFPFPRTIYIIRKP